MSSPSGSAPVDSAPVDSPSGRMPSSRVPSAKTIAALGIVTLFLLLPVPGLWHYQGPPMEEGFMLAFPQRILAGDLPHVDFLHLYGPGSLYVLAGVYRVFGDTLGVERFVGLVQHALLVFGMFALARPWGRRAATIAALTSLVITISPLGLSAMAWNGALGLAVAGLALARLAIERALDSQTSSASQAPSPTEADAVEAPDTTPTRAVRAARRALVGAAVLLGAALLYRPDMVVSVGLAAVAGWFVIGRIPALRSARRFAAIGGLVPLLLYIPFLLVVGPSDAIKGMFLQPVFDLRAGRSLPVPPSWAEPDGYLQKAGGLRVSSWPLPMPGLGPQIAMWFWLVPISIAFVTFVAFRAWRKRPGELRTSTLAIAAAFDLGLVGQALQRPDTAHLSWVTCVSFALVPLAIAELWGNREGASPNFPTVQQAGGARIGPAWRPLVAATPIAFILVAIIPFYPLRTYGDLVGQTFGHNRFGASIVRGDRVFYYGDASPAHAAQRVVDALAKDSKPGQRLIVGPVDLSKTPYSDAFFYYLFPELTPGTRYIEMDPGIADAKGSGLANELRHNDWLIQSDVWSGWDEPNDSTRAGDLEPNRIVRDDYCPVLDAGQFRLLRRCH